MVLIQLKNLSQTFGYSKKFIKSTVFPSIESICQKIRDQGVREGRLSTCLAVFLETELILCFSERETLRFLNYGGMSSKIMTL